MPKLTLIIYMCLLLFTGVRVWKVCSTGCGDIYTSNDITSSIHTAYDQLLRTILPSPHEELLLGITIGADYFSRLPRFNDAMKISGTIHVAVVSGFNINLVHNFLYKILGSKYKKKNFFISILITLSYAFLSGFDPPVLRAWLMGSTIAYGKLYGRLLHPLYVLVMIAIAMIAYNPAYMFSLSFQLSFMATLGLILMSEPLSLILAKCIPVKVVFVEDLCSSLAAQLFVWPLISIVFGTVSLISPIVNALLLWTIPIATILGFFILATVLISLPLARILTVLIYPFLDIFVVGVRWFSSIPFASIHLKLNNTVLLIYYILLLLIAFRLHAGRKLSR